MRRLRALRSRIRSLWNTLRSYRAAPEDKEDLLGRYFDTATHYYVAGRFAYFARAIPTAGNLFHHAIEMYLKGCLVRTHNEMQRRQLRHNLGRIWRRFKRQAKSGSLGQFDAIISDLNQFEDLRYPEKVRGWLIRFELTRQPLVASGPALEKARRFQLFLNEIDQLVAVLSHQANLNPKFFTGSLSAEGRAWLAKENVTGLW